jgi:hypothetical protein
MGVLLGTGEAVGVSVGLGELVGEAVDVGSGVLLGSSICTVGVGTLV